jgi:hypothetical protein
MDIQPQQDGNTLPASLQSVRVQAFGKRVLTPIRVACQNTLTMALNRRSTVRVTHTGNPTAVQKLARHSERHGQLTAQLTDSGSKRAFRGT